MKSNYQDSPLGTSSSSSDATQQQLQVHQVLYLLDRFAISDEFYHECSMLTPSLPRSYRIKRDRINATVELFRLHKPYSGCYRSFKECRKETTITAEVRCFKHYYQQPKFTFLQLENGNDVSSPVELVMGHRFPEFLHNYILFSFSLTSLQKSLSSSGQYNYILHVLQIILHTYFKFQKSTRLLCCMHGAEQYDHLREGLHLYWMK